MTYEKSSGLTSGPAGSSGESEEESTGREIVKKNGLEYIGKNPKEFKGLQMLQINFYESRGNKVGNNIKSLSDIDSLRSIIIGNQEKLTGDIKHLSGLSKLSTLSLESTGVSGDIASLKDLDNLKSLNLDFSEKIKGNIDVLSEFDSLKTATLFKTNVSGNINSLKDIDELSLDLRGTNVYGTVSKGTPLCEKIKNENIGFFKIGLLFDDGYKYSIDVEIDEACLPQRIEL